MLPGVASGAAASMPEWLSWLFSGGVGAAAIVGSQLLLQWRRQSADTATARSSTGLEIKRHRDRLTIDMLELARTELASARNDIKGLRAELGVRDDELSRLRRIEWRLAAYEEAIGHIEALIRAERGGDREAAEHAAKLFLARMEALKLKMGDDAQAEQIERARRLLDGRDGRDA